MAGPTRVPDDPGGSGGDSTSSGPAPDYQNPSNLSAENNFGYTAPTGRSGNRHIPDDDVHTSYNDAEYYARADPANGYDSTETTWTQDFGHFQQLQYDAAHQPAEDGNVAPMSYGPDAYLDTSTTTIIDHYAMMGLEYADYCYESYTAWQKTARGLYDAATNLTNEAKPLVDSWQSSYAKDQFTQRIGASTYSLREWAQIADTNASVMLSLWIDIGSAHTEMDRLWREYKSKAGAAAEAVNWSKAHPGQDGISGVTRYQSLPGSMSPAAKAFFKNNDRATRGPSLVGDPVKDVLEEYSEKSRQGPMNTIETGFSTANAKLNASGQIWRGMLNSPRADPAEVAKLMFDPSSVHIPGGSAMPSASRAAGAMPAMPSMPSMPAGPGGMPATPSVPAMNVGMSAARAQAMQTSLNAAMSPAAVASLRGLQGATNAANAAAAQARQAQALIEAQKRAAELQATNAGLAAQTGGLKEQLSAAQAAQAAKAQAAAFAALNQFNAATAPVVGPTIPGVPTLAYPSGTIAGLTEATTRMNVPGSGMLTSESSAGRPTMPALPSVPGNPGPAAGGMRTPGLPAMPGRMTPGAGGASIPGRTAPATPSAPMSPGRPSIGGRTTPGMPGTPSRAGGAAPSMPGRGTPTTPGIPGRTAGQPGGLGSKGTGPGGQSPMTPRSLAGRSDPRLRNLVNGRRAAGLPVTEGIERSIPSSSGLRGRTAVGRLSPGETFERARAALRRSTQGRLAVDAEAARNPRAGVSPPTAAGPRGQRPREEDESALRVGIIDDHELFDAEKSGDGLIAAAPDRGPVKKAGPALGNAS